MNLLSFLAGVAVGAALSAAWWFGTASLGWWGVPVVVILVALAWTFPWRRAGGRGRTVPPPSG